MNIRVGNLGIEKKSQQQPTFPQKSSIIGVRELDFRVRNGNGYNLSTMATGKINKLKKEQRKEEEGQYGQASRLISTARLNTSQCLYLQPINRMVSPESSED